MITEEEFKMQSGEEFDDEEKDDDDEDDDYVEAVEMSYACEDCDYRWGITFDNEEEAYNTEQYCPMCGSGNTTQL